MSSKFVSVGLPVYNGEKYIRRTIDSILSQTHENFELIVSDNGSIDETPEILRSYAKLDPRIRLLFRSNEDMQGQADNVDTHGYVSNAYKNFAKVLLAAKGPYFCWQSHDNFWHPDFLSQCLLNIGNGLGAMGGIAMYDSHSGSSYPCSRIPSITYSMDRLEQLRQYINNKDHGTAGVLYGLFKTEQLLQVALPVLRGKFFDWSDAYIVASVIALGGITIFSPENPLLFFGTEGAYVEKPANGISVEDKELLRRINLIKIRLILASPRSLKSALVGVRSRLFI
jgi:glycosyltransferase involved in cell wall biosynthesis